jgi:Protein of unknown function (DUF2971)
MTPWDCRPSFNKSELDDPAEHERTVHWFVRCDRTRNASLPEKEHLRREQELRADCKLLERMIDEMSSEMERAIQMQYRVYCLSTHPVSMLMWSHYADSCKGLCLEFSVGNELFCGALPVEYFDTYPLFSVAATHEDANLRTLLTKSAVWSYENEFRIVASEQPFVFAGVPTTNQGLLPLPKGALTSVIVGASMPIADRELVQSLVKDSGWDVAVKVAALVRDRYAFEIH